MAISYDEYIKQTKKKKKKDPKVVLGSSPNQTTNNNLPTFEETQSLIEQYISEKQAREKRESAKKTNNIDRLQYTTLLGYNNRDNAISRNLLGQSKKPTGAEEDDIAPTKISFTPVEKKSEPKREPIKLSPTAGQVTEDGYTDTGTTYGHYKYKNYAERKDYKIYEKDGRYFYYDEKNKKYISVSQSEMTSKELDKKDYEEAVKMGYKGSKSKLKLEEQIKLDTSNLSEKEYEEYEDDLMRQQEDKDEELRRKNEVKTGGAGVKGAIGEIKTAVGNVVENVDEEVVEPIRDAKDNYDYGKMSEQLGLESYKKMMGQKNNYDKLRKEYEKYIKFNQDIVEDGNLLDQHFQMIPNQIGGLKAGIQGGGVGGVIGAIGGGAIGAIVTRTPGGAIAGAKKGASILGRGGYVAGQTQYTYKLEAGIQYQTLIDMGVPEDIAKKEAQDTGLFSALIEAGESIADVVTLGQTSLFKEALKEKLIAKYGKQEVQKWLKKAGVAIVVSTGQNVISEGIEETLQEGGAIYNEKQATDQAGIERDDSQDVQRLIDAGISGGFSALVSGGSASIATRVIRSGADLSRKERIRESVKEQIDVYEKETGTTLTDKEKEALIEVTTQDVQNIISYGTTQKSDISGSDIAPVKTASTTDETALRSQNYVYQASETDSEYRRNLNEDASKYANNTTRSHEFVNTLANISEATRENIRLTNNTSPEMTQRRNAMIKSYAERKGIPLKEAKARLKNVVIDGYYTNDQIVINVDSPKALNRLVGHELTHALEKTGEYNKKLQKIAIEFAKSKKDYKNRLDKLIDLYEGQNANINKELVADIIGDYLFTDKEFIKRIRQEDRNLFQRIYDEIKHLIKLVTAGSKEEMLLEELKHSFEKAMRENKEMNKESKKATVQETKDKSSVEVESNTQEKEDSVQKTEKEEEYSLSEELENNLEKVMQSKKDQIDFFKDYLKENNIKNPTEQDMYDSWGTYEQMDSDMDNYVEVEKEYYKTIREYLNGLSKQNEDSKGRELTEEQIDFFEKTVIRDENGNLLVMYHGTRGEFYTFDLGRAGQNYEGGWSMSGRGFYFASDFKEAKEYAGASVNNGDIIIKEVYLNMTNPFYTFEDYTKELAHIKEKYNIDDLSLKAGYRLIDVLNQHGFDSTTVLKELGFDGVIEGARNDKIDQVMVFDSNQIKNVDNKKPTEDDDIRYSLTRASDEQVQQATELEKQDKTPEEIYLETGAYRGADGKWRTEIDDSEAKIINEVSFSNDTLEKVLDFPELYKAYPEMKNVSVVNALLPGYSGMVSKNGRTIYVNPLVHNSNEELKSTLLHEIQHSIQVKEGFSKGIILEETDGMFANGRYYEPEEAYYYSYGEQEARNVEERMSMSKKQRKETMPFAGNSDTVFAEDFDDIRYSLSDRTDAELKEALLDTRDNVSEQALKKMRGYIAEQRPDFFSEKTDNLGRKLSKGMKNFMKDSKARDVKDSLATVYHTMTDRGPQFNEFNPVGTMYYRFGDQVVNYFTDSKVMSGSYADQRYTMADTSKITSIDEVNKFLESLDNALTQYRLKELKDGKGYGITSFDSATTLYFENQEKLFKNVKEKLYRYEKQFGSKKGIEKYQYEGYVNITNPYVVDAEGRDYGEVERRIKQDQKDELDKIISDSDKVEMMMELASKSKERHEEYDFSGDEWTYYHYKNTADALKGRELNEAVQYCAMFGFEYNDYAKMHENLPSGDSTVTDLTTDLTDTNYNMFKDMTLSDFVRVYAQQYKNNMLYGKEDSYFISEYKNITGELNALSPSVLYKIANSNFEQDYINKKLSEGVTTNDIVFRVLGMNKEGSNYDGVIIKNVVDYGGSANGDYSPNNLYITFNSNQFKAWDNENPTDDPDIRYSLSELDNYGNKINPGLQKWAENSKARNEYGSLERLYHGTATGEFTVFDKNKANPEGDWGAGFYLTNNKADVEENYSGGGADFHQKVSRLAEQIEQEKEISYEDAYKEARNQLYKGQYTITSYANIENPAIVGQTYLFSDYGENYNVEDFESEEEYQEAVDQLVADDIDTAIWEIENTYDFYNGTEEIRSVLWEAYYNGGMEIQELKDKLNELYLETDEGFVANDVARIIIESLGYDGIIDRTVNEKARNRWHMNLHGTTTHYIVFKPNQIKNISNENPTDNPDINMSLSRTDDVAPVGENDIFGKDIAVQEQVKEAIAPLQEQIETLTKTISDLQENMAPASFDLAEEQRAETQRTMTDEDAPLTDEGTFSFLDEEVKVKKKSEIINDIASDFNIKKTEARELYNKIESIPELTIDDVYTELENYRKVKFKEQDDYVKSIQDYIRGTKLDISNIKKQIPDYGNVYRMSNMGKGLILGNSGQGVDTFYQELNELFPNEFPSDVVAEADQLELISQAMYKEKEFTYVDILDDDELQILAERIYTDIGNSERYRHTQSGLYFLNKEVKKMAPPGEINTNISEEEYADSLTTLDASNTEQVEETVSLEEELNELDRQKGPSIKKNLFDEVLDKFLEGQRPGKTTATPKVEKTKYENFRDTTQRLFVNEMVESDNLAKESGNLNIKYTGDMLNNVAGEIEGEIYTAQTDNEGHQIGKSLSALFSEAKKTGLYDAFNDYLEQYSNIDRHAQDKGSVVPLADSQRLVRHYEKTYPEFKQWGKGVWQYGANIRNNLIDAGIINEEFAETLGSMYPHYVPYMENREMTNYNPDLGEIKPKGVIKRATGGADNLLPIEEALTKYTFASKKAVRQNQFYQEIVATLDNKVEVGADVRSDALDLEDTLYRDETGNYLTAYFNGERLSVRISDDLYTGLRNDLKGQIKGLEEKFALITDPVQKLSEWRRNLLTSWNPMFIIKNPIMDVQDALFNSKYTKDFAKNYPKAFVELGQAKSETAKQFLTLYGSGNVMGEYSSDGSVKSNKFLRGIERANNIMELAPRYAEFKASLENGASLQEAMYNAREVTTNFGRGGVITKALNKNGFTFLNVSVQGFDKFIRNFSGENGAKGVTGALLKATLLGVIPAVFNELAFGGDDEEKDEDYDALPDYIKDNYYLIKTGDGQFIRIPKGRILSVFGSAGRRTIEYLQGEEDAFEGYLKNANSQIGISNPLDSNILTPLFQAFGSENGEAWYGGDIVPTRLQSKAPREQYDASTDKFSIWLGDKIGVSPYKINYVIDQYSGGMGDIFLPFITEESTSDAEGIELALAPIKDQFTANSTFDNKYAGDIYDLSDKMDKMPSSVKNTDEYKIQDAYLYSVTSEMGKLYAERRAVQENKELSKKEKYEKVQEIQKQINALAKEGLDNYKDVNSTSNYAIVGGREFNKYKSESGETRWGAVREDELEALNSYGLDIMEKSSYFNAKTYISQAQEKYKDTEDYTQKKRDIIAVIKSTLLTDEAKAYLYDKYYADSETLNTITSLGIDFDKYLDLEYQNFEADKNSAGKSISGSKKAKVFNYINSMDLSFEEKLVLTKLQYNSYNEYNGTVINYINSADLTYEQRVNILKKLGFKVDDYGNIKW